MQSTERDITKLDAGKRKFHFNGFSPYHDDPEMRFHTDGKVPYLREVLPLTQLVKLKTIQDARVHIVIPTLNEGSQTDGKSNVGTTIDNLNILQRSGLVDSIAVYDSGSTDDTQSETEVRDTLFHSTSRILIESPS